MGSREQSSRSPDAIWPRRSGSERTEIREERGEEAAQAIEARLDGDELVLVHVEVAAHLDLDRVNLVGRSAVMGGDVATLVGLVGKHLEACRLEMPAHERQQRRR